MIKILKREWYIIVEVISELKSLTNRRGIGFKGAIQIMFVNEGQYSFNNGPSKNGSYYKFIREQFRIW